MSDTASQCRRRGFVVGDTILGREEWFCGGWHEARMKLLWLGSEVAVFDVSTRTHDRPRWRHEGEQGNWTLECREWRKLTSGESA